MFKPHYGICKGTAKHEGCGEYGLITTRSRALCVKCEYERKPQKPIRRPKPKNLVENKAYYAKKIAHNIIINNGICVCENCDRTIKHPTGRNVSHIISAGANITLYLDDKNSYILCSICEDVWTSGDKTTMRIYEDSERRRMALNLKYYTKKP